MPASSAQCGGAGGSAGAMVAHMLGLPWYEGVAAGAFATEGMRAILRDAMVNPRIGTLVDFADELGAAQQIGGGQMTRERCAQAMLDG